MEYSSIATTLVNKSMLDGNSQCLWGECCGLTISIPAGWSDKVFNWMCWDSELWAGVSVSGPYHRPGAMWCQMWHKCFFASFSASLIYFLVVSTRVSFCATLFKLLMHLCPFLSPWLCWSETKVWPTKICSKVNGAVFFYLFV